MKTNGIHVTRSISAISVPPAGLNRDDGLLASERRFAPNPDEVRAIAGSITDRDWPEQELGAWLSAAQERQRARFEKLPDDAKLDDRILVRHQQVLIQNQMRHDEALMLLRTSGISLARAPGTPRYYVQKAGHGLRAGAKARG